MSKIEDFPNGLSIPKFLRDFPNILELWLNSPDNPPFYISPTFLCRWTPEEVRGRIKDRGHGRAIWKIGKTITDVLEAIDEEMGLEWPEWKYDKKADQKRYGVQKDTYVRKVAER